MAWPLKAPFSVTMTTRHPSLTASHLGLCMAGGQTLPYCPDPQLSRCRGGEHWTELSKVAVTRALEDSSPVAEAPPFGNTGKSLTYTGISGTHSSLTAWFTGSAGLTHGKQLTKRAQKALSKSEGLHTVPGTQLCLWTERSLISQVLV